LACLDSPDSRLLLRGVKSGEAGRTQMYTLYVLKSKVAKKSYVGITDDLSRRINEHNLGKNFYTKRYCPWRIIYTEEMRDRNEARRREKYLKSAAGRKFLKKFVFKE
jgi:putative endonuclease